MPALLPNAPAPMQQPDNILKHVAVVGLIAVVGYFSLYALDTHLRSRHGPWEVTFAVETNGTPYLLVNQSAYGVRDVKVRFTGEHSPLTSAPVTVRFTEPNTKPAFGELRFQDATYLPGTVTLLAFNHEVELIQRGLVLDRQERQWQPGMTMDLSPTNQAPPLRTKARKRNY
ncbi:MAG: hypothetical protein HZA92_15160 [Verrucomicrobia bacterium]|nr:hypothetical protein [Verrucomicrobiota bacterium]